MAPARPQKPWWEQRPKSPGDGGFEPERERLRAELARAWRALAAPAEYGAQRGHRGPATPFSGA